MSSAALLSKEARKAQSSQLLLLPSPTRNNKIVVIAIIALSAFAFGLGLPFVVYSLLGKQLVYFSFTQLLLTGIGAAGGAYLGIHLAKLWADRFALPKLERAQPWKEWVLTKKEREDGSRALGMMQGPYMHEEDLALQRDSSYWFVDGVRVEKNSPEKTTIEHVVSNLFHKTGITGDMLKEHVRSIKHYLTDTRRSAISGLVACINLRDHMDLNFILNSWWFIKKQPDRLEIVTITPLHERSKEKTDWRTAQEKWGDGRFLLETRTDFPFQKDLMGVAFHRLEEGAPKVEYRLTPTSEEQLLAIQEYLRKADTHPHPAKGIDGIFSKMYLDDLFSFSLNKI